MVMTSHKENKVDLYTKANFNRNDSKMIWKISEKVIFLI